MRLRKYVAIIVVVLAALFSLPTAVFFTVQHHKVQQFLVREATQLFSAKLNTTVSVGSIHFRLFNRLVLSDVYVQDLKGDTLFYAAEAAVSLSRLRFSDKYVEVSKLAFDRVKMSLVRDTSAALNMQFIVDGLKRQRADTAASKLKSEVAYRFKLNSVTAQGVSFSFVDEFSPDSIYDSTICYRNLRVDNMAVDVRGADFDGDTMTCTLESLKLRERSGFNLRRLSGRVSVAPTFIEVKNLQVLTGYSDIRAHHYRMDFDDYGSFSSYAEKVRMSADFTSAKLNLYTITFFSKSMPTVQLPLSLTGSVEGTVGNLKGRGLQLKYGVQTVTRLNFSMLGLPDVDNTFFTLDARDIVSTGSDLLLADSVVLNKKNARHAALLHQLGTLRGRARFTGFLSNFVADGLLSTDNGDIAADLSFTPAADSAMAINGTLGTDNFNLGSILNDSIVGRLSLYGKAGGTFKSLKKMAINLDVDIPLVELRGYAYQSSKIKGLLTEKSFDGNLSCSDKNLNFDFQGNVNFEKERSIFNFNLQLRHADLVKLHFITRDSAARVSLVAKANIEGNNLDDFTGKMRVSDARYLSYEKDFVIDSLLLNADNRGEVKRITLKSDVLDATLRARGGLSNLPAALDRVVGFYLPAFSQMLDVDAPQSGSAVGSANKKLAEVDTFFILVKNPQKVLDVLAPSVAVADSTRLSGRISADVRRTRLNVRTASARVGDVEVAGFALQSAGRDSALLLTAKANRVGKGSFFSLREVSFNTTLKAGRAAFTAEYKTPIASGNVRAAAGVFRDTHGDLGVDVQLDSSQLALDNALWNLSRSSLRYEKERISIQHFKMENANQLLYANGFISSSLHDTLTCEARSVDIAPLLYAAGLQRVDVTGELSGRASINGALSPLPLFFADIKAVGVHAAKREVGNVALQSFLEHSEKDVTLQLNVERGGVEVLGVGGVVKPTGEVLATAKLNGVKVDYLNAVLGDALSDIDGAVSGSVKVSGAVRQPQLNGKLQLENGALRVKILNAPYKFSGAVEVENSNVHMREWLAADDKNTTSRVSFSLFNLTQPSKLSYTLKVEPKNFHVLNNNALNSQHFYGQGYTSGVVQINGKKGETIISAAATTEKNTQVSIPLTGKEYAHAQQVGFIDFVTPVSQREAAKEDESVRVASNLRADLDFKVTPDAEVQLVLNQNTGDVIKAAGTGDIKLEVQPVNDIFRVFGTYNLMRGEYTVSIQNLFNLKFRVDNGSVINFNGDIDAATADIQASYKQLRVPLSGLFGDTTSSRYTRPVPIDCKVRITGRLTAPALEFSIDAPTVDAETRDRMRAQLSIDDNVVTQFMSLILIGQFVQTQGGANTFASNLEGLTLSNFLTSQFTGLLSQVFDGLDVSVKAPALIGQTAAEQDWGFMVSKSFGDRALLSVGGETQSKRKLVDPNASSFVYDFNVQYTLDKQGRWRLSVFSHANDQYVEMAQSSNRFGMGMIYQEEFDDLADLWQTLFRRKRQQDSLKAEQEKKGK